MTKNIKWQRQHGQNILLFLKYLNNRSDDFILKGGTSLMICYKLTRFSEDIDLDGKSYSIENIVHDFCQKMKYNYRVAKDTETVKRYMINYGNESHPLKIEVSYRRKDIGKDEYTKINDINVYNIENICNMKAAAYSNRDKIRDLYDLAFIINHYWNDLSSQTRATVREIVSYKGIEQFDYLVRDGGKDELIDTEKLAEDFLNMFDRLGLIMNSEEKQMIENNDCRLTMNELVQSIKCNKKKEIESQLIERKDEQLER